ncbi:tetratricopeptide repeat protein [Spirochaeta cellobiosiphila]|uniref:tetratricopeptide repeat protein n=1 Tax=Spirochaeta cellobiosiphila TaxID=504483 RepID=UPI0003F87BB3|nr:tetratricopeptide repeat protein [Spirochaeta cellobiosiphila]
MIDILPFLVIGSLVLLIILFFFIKVLNLSGKDGSGTKNKKRKDRNAVLREANRKLSINPKDTGALSALADIYYTDGDIEKAYKAYGALLNLVAMNPDLDEYTINLRYGLCAMKMKNFDEAYKNLAIARTMKQDVFEINNNLGIIEFQRKNYEKAAALLRQAVAEKSDLPETSKYLGHSLYKMKKFKESSTMLRKALDLEPDDKESMFLLAQSYFEQSQSDKALKIFTHLRPDPVMGPHAALMAGTINLQLKNFNKAIMDFEIGLKHQNLTSDLAMELRYRLGNAYSNTQELGKALALFKEIRNINPSYKDVSDLIKKYSELHSNRNLQTYLLAPTSEFVTLCRKITQNMFKKSRVKIIDIHVNKNEYADVLAEISTAKWEDVILFRFVRTTGQIGELFLRDLHARIKDMRAGRGFCMTPGEYSEGAQKFVEARLIDLVDKQRLMDILQKSDRF